MTTEAAPQLMTLEPRPALVCLRAGQDRADPLRTRPAPAGPELLALLVSDLEGFTALVEQLGDAAARELMRVHNAILRGCVTRHGGVEVWHTGDGMLAAFRSVASALEAAIDLQHSLRCRGAEQSGPALIARVGVHAGEPLPEEDRLFGTCVNTAARICARAGSQQIVVSEVVRLLAAGCNFDFVALGPAPLKGLKMTVPLHELRWRNANTACE